MTTTEAACTLCAKELPADRLIDLGGGARVCFSCRHRKLPEILGRVRENLTALDAIPPLLRPPDDGGSEGDGE